jgi:hypothetical protein
MTLCVFISILLPQTPMAGNLPKTGESLPDLVLDAPGADPEKQYLGLSDGATFSLDDISGELLIIEIVGVYCPQCHIQFPRTKTLFNKIEADAQLAGKVKLLAIAAGANVTEIQFLVKQFGIPYPVIPDTRFEVHKLLGEPRTPFTIVLTPGKKVAQTHLGVIPDTNQFFNKIKTLIR